jgi:zinc/manganese transport system permease protein
MQDLYDLLIAPFHDFGFMRRALVSCIALSLGSATIGVFLILRRMALMGDALSHSLLPGAAVGYLAGGLWLPAMSIGGFIAGVLTALTSGMVARFTGLREEASFAALYLTSLAIGVLIVSLGGSTVDLMHLLFGSVLAVDDLSLLLVAGAASISMLGMAWMYRPLLVECFNPGFLAAMGVRGSLFHYAFLALAVLNMVAAFQALGTLMALGLLLLPAVAAGFWTRDVGSMVLLAFPLALTASFLGLLVSFHTGVPSGPAIVLVASLAYFGSLALGSHDSVRLRLFPPAHLRG